ncbi:MAG: GtrA family protein [Gammaproteobacteria bacterium]|nr:GtrA family protein [Gammaproteobacteria bacterium]
MKKKFKHHLPPTHEIVKYGLIGIISNTVIFILYLTGIFFGMDPKIIMTILYISGASLSYWANRKWTFSHTGNIKTSGTRYFFSHFVGYTANLLILIAMIDLLGYNPALSQGFAIVIVALLLFLLSKYFVFSKKTNQT